MINVNVQEHLDTLFLLDHIFPAGTSVSVFNDAANFKRFHLQVNTLHSVNVCMLFFLFCVKELFDFCQIRIVDFVPGICFVEKNTLDIYF